MHANLNAAAIVADDHEMFRSGVSALLSRDFKFDRVIQAACFDETILALHQASNVTFVSLDLGMPSMNGAHSVKAVRSAFPETRLAVITASEDRNTILSLLQAGVHGFIPKTLGIREIRSALQRILAGEMFVPTTLCSPPTEISAERPPGLDTKTPASRPKLSPRQKEVFDLIAAGKSNKEIALKLGLSEGTVKVHVNALFKTLGAHNRVGAILQMSQAGSA